MKRIKVDADLLAGVFPEVHILPFLPRKKKKELKKKISETIVFIIKEGIMKDGRGEIHEEGFQYCENCKETNLHIPKMDAVKNGQRVCKECRCSNYY
jgi:hypothetical protein